MYGYIVVYTRTIDGVTQNAIAEYDTILVNGVVEVTAVRLRGIYYQSVLEAAGDGWHAAGRVALLPLL